MYTVLANPTNTPLTLGNVTNLYIHRTTGKATNVPPTTSSAYPSLKKA
jgi:acyl-CoA thioesterase FadM